MKKAKLLLALAAVASLYSCGTNEADTSADDTKPSATEDVVSNKGIIIHWSKRY